jgi:hypothetical protein
MKKLLSLFLAMMTLFAVFVFSVNAAQSKITDVPLGTHIISADGLWEYYKYERSGFSSGYKIVNYYGTETDITLPEEIDGISINSVDFMCNKQLENIVIPSCYIDFGLSCFGDCSNLKSVTFSREYEENDIKYFASQLFSNSENLESVVLPNYVPYYYESYRLPPETFIHCKSLKNIVLPDNVTEIGEGCFDGCSSLTEMVIPEGVTKIGSAAFENCTSLRSITFPDSLEELYDYSLSGLPNCSLIAHNDNECVKSFVEDVNEHTTGTPLTLITYSSEESTPTISVEPTTSTESPTTTETTPTSEVVNIKGDINNDGYLDINDVSQLQKHIAGIQVLNETNLDVDGNGKININDATLIQKIILKMI